MKKVIALIIIPSVFMIGCVTEPSSKEVSENEIVVSSKVVEHEDNNKLEVTEKVEIAPKENEKPGEIVVVAEEVKLKPDYIVIPDWNPEDGLASATYPEAIGFLSTMTEISEIENLAGRAPDKVRIMTDVTDSSANYLIGSKTFVWYGSKYFTNMWIWLDEKTNKILAMNMVLTEMLSDNQFNPCFSNGLGFGSTLTEFLDSGLLTEDDLYNHDMAKNTITYRTPYYTFGFNIDNSQKDDIGRAVLLSMVFKFIE